MPGQIASQKSGMEGVVSSSLQSAYLIWIIVVWSCDTVAQDKLNTDISIYIYIYILY